MKKIMTKLTQFHKDEEGTIVETGLIIGVLAVIAVGALVFLQPKIKAMFTKGGAALDQGSSVSY